MLTSVFALYAEYLVFVDIKEPHLIVSDQGHAGSCSMGTAFVAYFSHYHSNLLAILNLTIIVKSKMNARFEIRAYEYTIRDPQCVKAIVRSFEVTDLG